MQLAGIGVDSSQTLITAVVAVLVSLITSWYTIRLARLKADWDLRHDEASARRDYEYEARKRLYAECEPLVFQISEAAEEARRRILNLALLARRGDLDGTASYYTRGVFIINDEHYYLNSTAYILLTVPALFFLFRKKLTKVDLALDASISRQYRILKVLYKSFSDEFSFAGYGKPLMYEPNVVDWLEKRVSDPARHRRQGLEAGHLDSAITEMFVRSDEGERIRTFHEFSLEAADDGAKEAAPLGEVLELFRNFTPSRQPVLWRMLITQLALYNLLCAQASKIVPNDLLAFAISDIDRDGIRWHAQADARSDADIDDALDVATKYLESNLPMG